MKKTLLPPAAALAFGAAGFGLRLWGLGTAFEPDTGLPIPGAPATAALILLTAAALLLLGGLLWRMCRGAPLLSYDEAFRCAAPAAVTADVVCALLLAGAGLLGLWDCVRGGVPNLAYPVLDALLVASGGCVLLTGRNNYRGQGQGRFNAYLLLPAYAFCLWLVLTYQAQAGNPVILDYVYRILAIICSLLGLYFTAGFSFEKGKAIPALWTGLAAVYFSCVCLADFRGGRDLALSVFSIVYFTAHSAVLLRNLLAAREETPHE